MGSNRTKSRFASVCEAAVWVAFFHCRDAALYFGMVVDRFDRVDLCGVDATVLQGLNLLRGTSIIIDDAERPQPMKVARGPNPRDCPLDFPAPLLRDHGNG